jgi:hypothetical protein
MDLLVDGQWFRDSVCARSEVRRRFYAARVECPNSSCGVASFLILSQALKTLPVGTGYAMWTGIGAVGATILGILLFHEPRDAGRLVSIGLIISGVVGREAEAL